MHRFCAIMLRALLPNCQAATCNPACTSITCCYWQVRLWNVQSGTCDVTLSGHKGQVTALKYNQQGGLLASGAQDTDIIVWDIAAESGLYRLQGHQDQVTDLVSLSQVNA